MIHYLIIDDEPIAHRIIEKYCSNLPHLEKKGNCYNAFEAMQFLNENEVNLLFLDINMPKLSGFDFLKNLRNQPKVIFTTAHREYAIESYELNVVDYLLKPIVFNRFFKAIEKFLETQIVLKSATSNSELTHIFVKSNQKNIKLNYDDILFVESIRDYIKIHTVSEKLVIKHGISAFEEKLDNRFIRVHRSYIVNKQKVTAYTKEDIEIGKIEVPIGYLFKKNTLEKLQT